MNTGKKLYRSTDDKILSGVCAGLGDYFNIDHNIMRLIYMILTLLTGGAGIIIYIVLTIIVPPAPY